MMRLTDKRISIQNHMVSRLVLSLFLLTVCGLSTDGTAIVTDGVVHYWSFDKDTINGKQTKMYGENAKGPLSENLKS